MDFRLLGPLEVTENDRPLALGGVKQRSLLAILLLQANDAVSTDQLIDQLWGGEPPATCAKSIQVYVSRLRKEIGDGRLLTRAPGYLVRVDPEEIDIGRFERLTGEAAAADPETAARKLREALALWHGPALADLAYEPFAQAEIARLDELRMAALEQRIDADLAVGRHAELVGELEGLTARHPLREGFRGQLMLALYRSARQAEALEAYRAARHELSEELGLEPSERLKRLEQAILRHDPALDLPDEAPPVHEGRAPEARPGERAILVVPREVPRVGALLRIAQPLAASEPPHELIVAAIVPSGELGVATAALAARRAELLAAGLAARTAAFSSPNRGDDVVRLAAQENIDLLLMDAGGSPLDGDARVILEQVPCDVALMPGASGPPREGPVLVPFGAGRHDWAALQVGAWVARATDSPLRLMGSAADHREESRDASRLLADASLIVQRTAGIVAEPLIAPPGRRGIRVLAEGAGLLVVGLSDRWREEGLGGVRTKLAEAAPTLFIRRGTRPGGLAPVETRTPFSWSLTAKA